ncbi:hypothetical protein Tco_0697423 [Tanacetum coccineum]
MRVPNVSNCYDKLMLFPALSRERPKWLEKEPPRSIQTWDDLVSKFINQFFLPSIRPIFAMENTRFQQELQTTSIYTFYNALNINDQDSLNSAAGGNFLDKMPRECLKIIESKSKVRQTRAKAVVAKCKYEHFPPKLFHLMLLKLKYIVPSIAHRQEEPSCSYAAPAPCPKQLS